MRRLLIAFVLAATVGTVLPFWGQAAVVAQAPPAPAAQPAQVPDPPEPAAAKAHVARATQVAGRDLAAVAGGYLCKAPQESRRYLDTIRKQQTVPPLQAFDNLYYIGLPFVGTWVLKTSEGLILWDTLDNAKEAQEIPEPGLVKLGLAFRSC